MTITQRIRNQLFASTPQTPAAASPYATASKASTTTTTASAETAVIRLPLTRPLPGARKRASRAKPCAQRHAGLGWSDDEHERFLRGLELYPAGPWKEVAAFVGTRTTRQVMTHAQKYRQKIARRARGLQLPVRKTSNASASDIVRATKPSASIRNKTPSISHVALEPAPVPIEPHTDCMMVPSPDVLACAIPSAPSPSSTEHFLRGFALCSHSGNADANAPFEPLSVAMTVNEFELIDELFITPTWSPNAFEDTAPIATLMSNTDDSVVAHSAADPLALAFQDSNTLAWTSKAIPVDVYFAPWETTTPATHMVARAPVDAPPYECQL